MPQKSPDAMVKKYRSCSNFKKDEDWWGTISGHAQNENYKIKIEEYDMAMFNLVMPGSIGNQLYDCVKEVYSDTVVIFYLKLSINKNATITKDSIWFKCMGNRESLNKLSHTFSEFDFKAEDISFIKSDNFSFTLPIIFKIPRHK